MELAHVLKQILISIVAVAAVAAGYFFFVPGAPETLARFGVTLPVPDMTATPNAPTGPRAGGPRGGNARAAAVVVTAEVGMATINDRLTAIGEAAAAHAVTVTSPANGTLTEILVTPGDVVAAGAVIARLDADAEEIAHRRAQLALANAQATLARVQELATASNATTVQLRDAELAVENALLEAETAALALSRRSIVSPVGGTVGLIQATAGNAVTSQSVVTTVVDTSHLVVSFWAPERYAAAIVPGMEATVSAVALPGADIRGEISAVDNRVDSTTRTLEVQARIPNDGGRLRPGMSFSVTMNFAGNSFPTVDPLAIQWSSDGPYLWRYVDGRVERLAVEVIQRNSDGVLVDGPLTAGDQVVTQGLQQLTAGASVRLLDEVAGGAAEPRGPGGPGRDL